MTHLCICAFIKKTGKSQTNKDSFKIHTAHTQLFLESVLLIISLCGIFSTVKKDNGILRSSQ